MKAFFVTLALLLANAAGADDKTKDHGAKPVSGTKNEDQAGKVDVLFANGSKVVMEIIEEKIDMVTDYGKLSIPPKDIRHIDFGVHLSRDEEQKIADALKRLGSDKYKDREAAMKQLVALGPHAYLALGRAAKSGNLEVVNRAKEAMKHIAQKVPRKLLRLNEEDKIRTVKFTVVGRITTPTIKARAEYFGELPLKPGQLLAMSWLVGPGANDLTIDAAKYGSAPNQWLDTGIVIEPGWGVKFRASGQVDLWPQQPGQYLTGPNGMPQAGGLVLRGGPGMVAVQGSGGALMGRIGDGASFLIGDRKTLTSEEGGKLHLHILPSPWNNASTGSYRVRITTGSQIEEDE